MNERSRSFNVAPVLDPQEKRLVHPCDNANRPDDPDRSSPGPTLALTFSGGGFRATFSALGVIRYLADVGLLSKVRYVSSVSGGSIASAMLAHHWDSLRRRAFSPGAVDELVIDPIIASISSSSLKLELVRNIWRAAGPRTRTNLLADALDRRFFEGQTLESLDSQCRWIFNASNLVTGVRFAFERDYLGDYVTGLTPTTGTGISLSTAVAASAAVPGAFAPLRLRGIHFPCPPVADPLLLDGGVYDNTGLTALDGDDYHDLFFVCLNAGGVFPMGRPLPIPIVGAVKRAEAVLYRQSTTLRTDWMVDRFKAYQRPGGATSPEARQGVLFALSTTIDSPGWGFPEQRMWGKEDLAFVPTSFDRFDRELCRLLVHRGWWLTGATMAKYHPQVATASTDAPPLDLESIAAGDRRRRRP